MQIGSLGGVLGIRGQNITQRPYETPNLHFLEEILQPIDEKYKHESSPRIADRRGCSILNVHGDARMAGI